MGGVDGIEKKKKTERAPTLAVLPQDGRAIRSMSVFNQVP